MAALLLRQGAAWRTLGGSMVRRAERRRMHTEEHVREKVQLEIQQLKEQAYDALALGQQISFSTSSFRNRLLLAHIAVQIKPRPEDFQWRRMYFARKALTMLETVALISLAYTVYTVGAAFTRKKSKPKTRLAKN